jgi:hypothetical protein
MGDFVGLCIKSTVCHTRRKQISYSLLTYIPCHHQGMPSKGNGKTVQKTPEITFGVELRLVREVSYRAGGGDRDGGQHRFR